MSDYEKSSVVTYPFYFVNRKSIHKKNCMQRIKRILMREVFPVIALKIFLYTRIFLHVIYVGARLNGVLLKDNLFFF